MQRGAIARAPEATAGTEGQKKGPGTLESTPRPCGTRGHYPHTTRDACRLQWGMHADLDELRTV